MLVLALDTSSAVGSVALVRDGVTLVELASPAQSRHGETLVTVVERALVEARVAIGDVELVAVGTGPGSFTGLRVALATAKGVALARGVPLVGVSSLAALARGARPEEGVPVVALTDAHKGELFGAVYAARGEGPLEERVAPFSLSPEAAVLRLRDALGDALARFVGDGCRLFPAALASLVPAPPALETPGAAALADEALRLFRARGASDLATLEPVYVRDADVT